jgi:hypothetical protein
MDQAAVPQPFTSFESLLRFFSDADEIVFQLCFKSDDEQIALLCREARHMAHHLHMHFGTRFAGDLARVYGVEMAYEQLQIAGEQAIYLARCNLRPPMINLNLDAIQALAEYGQNVAGKNEKKWFANSQIAEVVTAQELYQIIRQNSSLSAKMAAHCFARTFTGIPFSSLLYNTLLQQARG